MLSLRVRYVPNPSCTSPLAERMFEFVGKLLGISARTEGFFPVLLPPFVYKLLLGQPVTMNDLAGIDSIIAGENRWLQALHSRQRLKAHLSRGLHLHEHMKPQDERPLTFAFLSHYAVTCARSRIVTHC